MPMTFAIVNVLPEPVTAEQHLIVQSHFHAFDPAIRSPSAGRPVGLYSETSLKSIGTSEVSVVCQRNKIVVGDNDVVGQHNTDRLQNAICRPVRRGIQILGTRQRVAARVVVRQNDRGRVLVERGLDDFSHADGGRRDAPAVHRHTADGLALCVQTPEGTRPPPARRGRTGRGTARIYSLN